MHAMQSYYLSYQKSSSHDDARAWDRQNAGPGVCLQAEGSFCLDFWDTFLSGNLGAALRRSLSAIEKYIKQTKNVLRPTGGYERNDDLLAGERY